MTKKAHIGRDGKAVADFHYAAGLDDFGGDRDLMQEDLDLEQAEFDRIAEHLPSGAPHPMAFRDRQNDAAYQAAFSGWQANETEARTARGTANALAMRDQANYQPPPVDWDFMAVTQSPHPEDRKRARERLATRETVARLLKEAERAEKAGDVSRARELFSMADAQARGDEGSYTFEREYNQKLATDAETTLKQAEKQGWLTGDPEQYRGLATCFNHENEKDNSYAIRMSEDGSKFQVVNLEHSGRSGRNVSEREGDDYVDNLMRLSYPEGSEEKERESASEPEPERNPHDPEQMTQKEFEAMREAQGAPHH